MKQQKPLPKAVVVGVILTVVVLLRVVWTVVSYGEGQNRLEIVVLSIITTVAIASVGIAAGVRRYRR